ncbi:hypothetical protein IFR05_011770 [Cadophora sp. M221]|nr:hypothetical protein IFR05_011770 [Cadophora sp. M221]
MTLGRPFGIHDQEIDIEVDTNERAKSATPGHIEYLHKQLSYWRDSSPQVSTQTTLSVFDSNSWFNLAYNHSILLLYRGQLTRHYSTAEPRPQDIFLQCSRAAQEICLEYRRLHIKQQPVSYTWGALIILFLAGLTYLHCLWTSDISDGIRQDEISNTCTACTMVLVVLAERWEQAAPHKDIFEALASKTMAMIVDKHREFWMLPAAPIHEQQGRGLDYPGEMAHCVTDISGVGMSDSIESLLTGLAYEFGGEESRQIQPWLLGRFE